LLGCRSGGGLIVPLYNGGFTLEYVLEMVKRAGERRLYHVTRGGGGMCGLVVFCGG
jgi:hypothetical protein